MINMIIPAEAASESASKPRKRTSIRRLVLGGWPGLNDPEFVDMKDVERISLQQFPWKQRGGDWWNTQRTGGGAVGVFIGEDVRGW
jgi:hypothetical protein